MSLGMLGKYERLSVLGRGVSGIVYLAKDTLLNRQVALKEVDVQAGDLRRFLEEARVMDRLRHPNIVRVNSIDRIEDKVVIDMEYVRGKNLQELLRVEGTFSIPKALKIAIQTLDGLAYAHSMQTVHRDVKPANILLDRDGAVKLADFGLAEILSTNAYACGAGTYAYMAPEDFAEESHSDSQSDIWAVAVTLFEMVSGQRPFIVLNPKSPFSWKRALEIQEPRPLEEVLPQASAELAAGVARGLARDKDRRYQTAAGFRNTLNRILEAEYGESVPIDGGVDQNVVAEGPVQDVTFPEAVWKRTAPRTAAERFQSAAVIETDTVPVISSKPATPARKGLARLRSAGEARIALAPARLDFGSVRSGESRQSKCSVRVSGHAGPVCGRVVSAPDWLTVFPPQFDGCRQTLRLTVNTGLAPMLGVNQASVAIETEAGSARLPVHVNVLKPRPTFRQIAAWFVPLFGLALAPATITATLGSSRQYLLPPAAASSLSLSVMLLVISIAADLGIAERLSCGVIAACMCFVLGAEAAAPHSIGYNSQLGSGPEMAAVTAIGFGLVIIVQFLTARRWKFWGCVLASLGILLGGVCYHAALS